MENKRNFDQDSYIRNTINAKELLQKELDVTLAEQKLLGQRMREMQPLMNSLPSYDPNYTVLALQLRMDQIELDELRAKELIITERLKSI